MPYKISKLVDFIDAHDPKSARESIDGFRREFPDLNERQNTDIATVESWIEANWETDPNPSASVLEDVRAAAKRLAYGADHPPTA